VEVVRHGPFSLTATVTSARQTLRYTVTPTRTRERVLAGLARATTLLRPPAVAVASALAPYDPEHAMPQENLRDPLLRAGAEPGLLAGAIVVALALAGLAWWRLRRLGASVGRTALWSGTIALTGLPGYLAYRLSETDRAWRPVAPAPEPAGAPLISSLVRTEA
jgi:hypothetical protein